MTTIIEGLYIFSTPDLTSILEHTYTSRPPAATILASALRSNSPLPSTLYLPSLLPPTIVHTLSHSSLLFCTTTTQDSSPLAHLTFLQRLLDILEDFLAAPLLPTTLSDNYETIAQILTSICDGGIISNTEPNSLHESITTTSAIGKLLNQVGLPSNSPALSSNLTPTLKSLSTTSTSSTSPSIPWRRSNVRHTSNEVYVDILESLSLILTPSGRPIHYLAHGSVLFTAKLSGVPDLTLTLSAPGGTSTSKSAGLSRTLQLPTFHPCVRLNRWRENPGELSFVPPDGKFMLASYESDLMPSELNRDDVPGRNERVFMPVTADLRTSGNTFTATAMLNTSFPGVPSSSSTTASSAVARPFGSRTASSAPFSFGSSSGSSAAPTLEAVVVTIPFLPDTRSVTELKPSRGEAVWDMKKKEVEWKIPTSAKDGSVAGTAQLTGVVTGALGGEDETVATLDAGRQSLSEYYDEETLPTSPVQTMTSTAMASKGKKAHKISMPRSILVSFGVKGWLASGIRVESLNVDTKKSKGLGEGVKPYKGVKYLTVSKRGVERRVE